MAVLANGRLITGSYDNTVKVWDEAVETGSGMWDVKKTLTGHSDKVMCVAALADGRFATGSDDTVVCVAVLNDGRTGPRLVTGSYDMSPVKVWEESSPGSGDWSVQATLAGHRKIVTCVAVLADGRFVTGSADTTVKVWKESSPGSSAWSVEATLAGHSSAVNCVAVLADGRFATGGEGGQVYVWHESSPGVWDVEATLTGHSSNVRCMAVIPQITGCVDGRFVTGSDDNTVKVWKESSPGNGEWGVEATLTGHSSIVMCVAVLADGSIATGSWDKTVKVWKELWSFEQTLT